jgi:hypothetical protein
LVECIILELHKYHKYIFGGRIIYYKIHILVISDGIEAYELEDFIAEIMNREFDTVTDDNSIPEVIIKINETKVNVCLIRLQFSSFFSQNNFFIRCKEQFAYPLTCSSMNMGN